MGKSHFNSYIVSYALQWITYIFQIFLNTCEQDYTEIIYKYLKDTYCDFWSEYPHNNPVIKQ